METKIKNSAVIHFVLVLMLCFTSQILLSCGNDDEDDLKKYFPAEYSMDAGNTHSFGHRVDWTSDNPLIVTIDENNHAVAKHVGSTYIRGGGVSIKVNVRPTNKHFVEPLLTFGASPNDVKNLWSGYTSLPGTETDLLYRGEGNVDYYMYSFTDNKLAMSTFVTSTAFAEDVLDFLLERYCPLNANREELQFSFYNPQKTMVVLMQITTFLNTTQSVVVSYGPVSSKSSMLVRNVKGIGQPSCTIAQEDYELFEQLSMKFLQK